MKRILYCLGGAAAAALFLSLLFSVGVFSNVNVRLVDNLYGGGAALQEIVIVGIDDDSLQEIGRWPWNRTVFADVVGKLEGAKVVGIDIAFFEPSDEGDDLRLEEAIEFADNVVLAVEFTGFDVGVLEMMESRFRGPSGYVNIPLDKDGVNRRVNLNMGNTESFAQALYKKRFGRGFGFGEEFLINFVGPPGSFDRYSFVEVLDGSVDLTGKIVLIGATSPGFHDDYLVPTSEGTAMPGVEVHANILQTMLTRNFLFEQTTASVIIWIFGAALLAALIMYFLSLKVSTTILAFSVVGYIFFSIIMFSFGKVHNLMYVPLSIILTYIVIAVVFYVTEKKVKTQIVEAFKKYVSPEVVGEIMKQPGKLKLGGSRKQMTILFSDIRSFTSISEKMTPEELVAMLNEYFTEMADVIMENRGLVDKFIGDAIMALWGVPLPEKEHAKLACESALQMREKVKNHKFEIGIGLNTGEAVVGNIGSENRFDYTAIGDAVNLGSRIEGLTKQYGVQILISESTHSLVDKDFVTRKIDLVAVKGKKKPVWVYELICRKDEKYDADVIENYEKGLHFYLKKDWGKAIGHFKKVKDKASGLFIDRCEDFKKNAPPKGWNGVFEVTRK